jgi:hypothetical protein
VGVNQLPDQWFPGIWGPLGFPLLALFPREFLACRYCFHGSVYS